MTRWTRRVWASRDARVARRALGTVALYGLALAAAALVLQALEYRFAMRSLDPSLYAAGLALVFTALGIWVGWRLTGRAPAAPFAPNENAIAALGISPREREVLGLVAAGHANKEIARLLGISPNTVKTHVASLFAKLEATRRVQALRQARALGILP